MSASTSNTSGYKQSFYFYSNGDGYNGHFLSISEDVDYNVCIFTIANNGNNLSPNLNISTLGSINLNVHSDNNPNKSCTISLRDAGSTYGYFNSTNGFTISSQSGNLNLNAAGGNAVTTNYVAPYSTSGGGIINQTALSKIIPTISINNDNPNVLYLQSNNKQIPSYLESDGRTRQYYIYPPSAVGMYFLNMTDAGHTQHTCFIVVCTSQSVNSNSYNVKNINNGGCYVDSIVTFTPYNGVVLNVTVPGGNGGIYNWIPLLLTP